jgi:hypothetical protein
MNPAQNLPKLRRTKVVGVVKAEDFDHHQQSVENYVRAVVDNTTLIDYQTGAPVQSKVKGNPVSQGTQVLNLLIDPSKQAVQVNHNYGRPAQYHITSIEFPDPLPAAGAAPATVFNAPGNTIPNQALLLQVTGTARVIISLWVC